jgi:putative nucleotidyltransferase with HDIG domain
MTNLNEKIPLYVSHVTETLQKAGFEAYLVGGCVRDIVLGREPKDWDVTTNATPEQIIELFEKTFYENNYGTVGVVVKERDFGVTHETTGGVPRETSENDSREVTHETTTVEVTPYRTETTYSDSRHPDSVAFGQKLEEDLQRRDFTVNALAYDPTKGHVIDLYNGQQDIKDKVIRAVGKPAERFNEDALRILRAVRFSTELGFELEEKTKEAVKTLAPNLEKISKERIRDEFIKMIISDNAMQGIILAHELGVLQYIVPELEKGIGVKQNGDHIYVVWEHNLRALNHAVENKWPLHVRLAALFHDISKPETRRWSDEKKDFTFYGHDVVGGRVTKKLMQRLKFPGKITDVVSMLVRYHLFFSDVEKITLSAVRRIVKNVGPENVWDLMKVRACDRIGMGRPKEKPYRLRKYEAMIEEAMRAPVSVGMLKIDGSKIMEITGEKPGPRLGWMLHAFLEEVLDDPEKNTDEYLTKRLRELAALPDSELRVLGEKGKGKKEEKETQEVGEIRKRHWVK